MGWVVASALGVQGRQYCPPGPLCVPGYGNLMLEKSGRPEQTAPTLGLLVQRKRTLFTGLCCPLSAELLSASFAAA